MASFVERAQNAQELLFSRYDKLNERLTEAEKRLTSFHIPHQVSFVYKMADDDFRDPASSWTAYEIAISKIKGNWRLCHAVTWHHDPSGSGEEPEFTPLVECSAFDRVEAARHLAKLEEKIIEAAEKFVARVDKAVDALDQYLSSVQ